MRYLLIIASLLLVSLAAAFEAAWFRTYNGPAGGLDQAYHVRFDPDGNPLMFGTSQSGGNTGTALVKFSKAGVFQWAHRFDVAGEDYIDPHLASDGQGNFYIATTRSFNGGSDRSVFLRKVNGSNVTQWSREWVTTGHIDDQARGLILDTAGNVYILSEPIEQYTLPGGTATTRNMAVRSYTSSGTFRWERDFASVDAGNNRLPDYARAISIDSGSNILVTGDSDLFGSQETDVILWKLGSGGTEQWGRRYEGLGGYFDGAANHIGADANGNVFVTGTVRLGQFDDFDILTLKYSPTGTFIWSRYYDGPVGSTDKGFKLTTDAVGNVYVAGQSWRQAGRGADAVIIKYGPDSDIFTPWFYSAGGGDNDERFLDVFIDSAGTIHGAGALGFELDAQLYGGWSRFFPAGGFSWSVHAYQNSGDAIFNDGIVMANGDVYLAGRAGNDMMLVRLIQDPIGLTDTYAAVQNQALTVATPGLMANDLFVEGASTVKVANPLHGTVTVNANGSFTYTPTTGYTGPDTFTYKINKGTMSSANVTVNLTVGGVLQSLTISPESVPGGVKPTATITLGTPAPAGGAVIALSNSNPTNAQIPSSITVPQGASSATFQISTVPPNTGTATATITATYKGVSQSATLTITPTGLVNFWLEPTSVIGGESVRGIVLLSYPAPAGGKVVTLSDNSSSISTPASVTVPAGSRSASFTVTTAKIGANAVREIYATMDVKRTARLTILSTPTLMSLTVTPATVKGGTSTTGKVTLNIAAPAPVRVTISDNSTVLNTPSSVTVATGQTQATFTINTGAVGSTATRQVTASYQGVTRTANVTLTP